MSYNQFKSHRKSPRLSGWDYSRPGAYFLTINVKGRVCSLGEIDNNKVILSEVGKIAFNNLNAIPEHFPHVSLDVYVVMPNHVHLIVFIEQDVNAVRKDVPVVRPYAKPVNKEKYYRTIAPKRGSLSVVIRSYKDSVKKWCNNNGYGDFKWQPRYHDRIIRSNQELKNTRKYIIDNPNNWDKDENNPLNDKRT